jgi:hypothetical protein
MKADKFAQIVKQIRDESINDIITFFTKPPGRRPRNRHLDISNWFNNLTDNDKLMARELVKESIHSSLFSLLCAIDGARRIENEEEMGQLKLYYLKDNKEILINDPDNQDLHDLYNYLIQNEQTD